MVYWGGKKWGLHMVPSGIFHAQAQCLIGAGCVVNPTGLKKEMEELSAAGINVGRVKVDGRAHLVMPWHGTVDRAGDKSRGIGTTGRGIGPTYADKSSRIGLRVSELVGLSTTQLFARVREGVERANLFISGWKDTPVNVDDTWTEVEGWIEFMRPLVVDGVSLMKKAIIQGETVLLEGQLGIMRDLDWGTYPYVTSSNSMVSGVGAGIPSRLISNVMGVVKAYTTAVGAGPFPTEDTGELGSMLRELGAEYGVTTGRPRRCGWYDTVAVGHGAWLSGYTSLALTKLDVLDTFEEVKLCVAYELDGKRITHVPDTMDLERCRPVYETHPGWLTSTRGCRVWSDLPPNAQRFVKRIEELAGVRVIYVSVGPERGEVVRAG